MDVVLLETPKAVSNTDRQRLVILHASYALKHLLTNIPLLSSIPLVAMSVSSEMATCNLQVRDGNTHWIIGSMPHSALGRYHTSLLPMCETR